LGASLSSEQSIEISNLAVTTNSNSEKRLTVGNFAVSGFRNILAKDEQAS
jgi:hypothetical protein